MAKGQMRSNREKKKPKADQNKKKSAAAVSPFALARPTGKAPAGRGYVTPSGKRYSASAVASMLAE
ncbi:MAG TPA: hypothetical protein VGJ20_14460 [Xanthobacteraceae bacterium]